MNTYFPVLKSKPAEFLALENLGALNTNTRPVVDVIPRPLTRKAPLTEKSWYMELAPQILGFGLKYPVVVDPFLMETLDGACTARGLFDWLASLIEAAKDPIYVIPAVRLGASAQTLQAARRIVHNSGSGLAVRLTFADIQSVSHDGGASLRDQLDRIFVELNLQPDDTDLLLDLEQISSSVPAAIYVEVLLRFIQGQRIGWRHIAIVGSSAPAENSVAGFDMARTPRTDLEIWESVKRQLPDGPSTSFGDYGGFAPLLPNGNARTKHPSLRYTLANEAILVRRKAIAGEGHSVYTDVCQFVVAQPWYQGSAYSWGDDCIEQTAQGNTNPAGGGAIRWRATALNHHMTLTASQVSSLLVS